MKLYSIVIGYKGPKVNILKAAFDLTSFGYFQRGSVQEFMSFTSQIIIERTTTCTRSTVKEKEYLCHCYVRQDNLAGVVISDHEYTPRVAQTLLMQVLDDFAEKIPPVDWPTADEKSIAFPGLDAVLAKYQNPREADAMCRIQADLDDTKIVMHGNIEAVLNRGEKLDDLVSKSEALGTQSKAFYKTARKTNSCCVIQ